MLNFTRVSYVDAKSWFNPNSVFRLGKNLFDRFPEDMKNMRFITLTLDPNLFVNSQNMVDGAAAYEAGHNRLRRFFAKLSKNLGVDSLSWIWKLEFQQNGLPHWHLIVDYRKPINFTKLQELWGLGFVWVARLKNRAAAKYVTKYATKAPTHEGAGLPDWLLDYPRRVRIYQSYNRFLTPRDNPPKNQKTIVDKPKKPQDTLRTKIHRWEHTVVLYNFFTGHSRKLLAIPAKLYITILQAQQALLQNSDVPDFVKSIQPWCATVLDITINQNDYSNEYDARIALAGTLAEIYSSRADAN